jgi:hypothetical protein
MYARGKARAVALAVAAPTLMSPVFASPIQVTFTGTVSVAALGTTTNSGYTEGQSISGQFFIDSVTGLVSGATLGTFSAASDNGDSEVSAFSSTNDLIFSQGAFDSGGASSNDSVTIDLSTLTSFTATSPVTFLLQSPTALAQQIDFTGANSTFPSTATFYSAPANGSGITAVRAYLSAITVLAASVTESAMSVSPGQSSTLTVTPAGTGTFTYQWYQGTTGNTANPISGATGASFTTPPLSSSTSYWVQVTSSTGTIEDSATITITVATSGTVGPTDGPLPAWAFGLLGAGLISIASRRLKKLQSSYR